MFGYRQAIGEQRLAEPDDIARTQDSRAGNVVWRLERQLGRRGLRMPFGIRSLVVARRPETGA